MEEWEDVDIEAVSDGLDALPTELHAFFEVTSDHLGMAFGFLWGHSGISLG